MRTTRIIVTLIMGGCAGFAAICLVASGLLMMAGDDRKALLAILSCLALLGLVAAFDALERVNHR